MRVRLITGIMAWMACSALFAEISEPVYLGIDAKGVRHEWSDARGNAPWITDLAYAKTPTYPPFAGERGYTGFGKFRIGIDAKTGAASNVEILQSTGHVTLDRSVLLALKLWRWKPETWTQVEVPIAFTGGRVLIFPKYTRTLPVRR